MFCLTDQDCDSKWTKIKTSLRSHQQSPPFSKVGAAQRALRRGLTFDIGGKTLNIITSGQQTLNGVKMNRQKANKTGKTREEKIDAIYLLFLRTLFSCDAYDGMGNISSRHLPVSQQTLPTRALVWVITLVSGLAPHCSTAPVSRQILPHLAPNTPTLSRHLPPSQIVVSIST